MRDLAARSATYPQLRRVCPLLVSARQRHVDEQRRRRRLRPTEELVLGYIRRAVRAGAAGAHLTVAELARLAGKHERSVQRALASLGPCAADCAPGCSEHIDQLRRVPLFDDVSWCHAPTRRVYHRRQLANVIVLSRRAAKPGRQRNRHAAATPAARPVEHFGGVASGDAERSAGLGPAQSGPNREHEARPGACPAPHRRDPYAFLEAPAAAAADKGTSEAPSLGDLEKWQRDRLAELEGGPGRRWHRTPPNPRRRADQGADEPAGRELEELAELGEAIARVHDAWHSGKTGGGDPK